MNQGCGSPGTHGISAGYPPPVTHGSGPPGTCGVFAGYPPLVNPGVSPGRPGRPGVAGVMGLGAAAVGAAWKTGPGCGATADDGRPFSAGP